MSVLGIANGFLRFFSLIRPVRLKQWLLSKMMNVLLDLLRLQSWFSQIRLPVYVVSGVEKNSGEYMSVLFVGRNRFPVYFRNLIFAKKPVIKRLRHVFIWKLNSVEKLVGIDFDMVLVSCDQFFKRFLSSDDFFVFPHMVDFELDTTPSLKELVNRLPHSASEDVKKVQKNDFSFQICSNVETLRFFYDEMYQPTIRNRIGETDVFIPNFLFLKYLYEIGYKLMIISYKGKSVCGVLFVEQDDSLLLKYAGVLEGDTTIIRKGAFSAFYYFFMIYAKERGVNRVDFEGARPFFHDGLFQYKRKWGTAVKPHLILPELFAIKQLNETSDSVRQFLINNPFVGFDQNKLTGFVFISEENRRKKIKLEQKFSIPGVEKLRFIEV